MVTSGMGGLCLTACSQVLVAAITASSGPSTDQACITAVEDHENVCAGVGKNLLHVNPFDAERFFARAARQASTERYPPGAWCLGPSMTRVVDDKQCPWTALFDDEVSQVLECLRFWMTLEVKQFLSGLETVLISEDFLELFKLCIKSALV